MAHSGKPSNKAEKLVCALLALALLCFFAVFAVINFAGFERFCNADMYNDVLVAKLMWEQKTLFPDNFVFGNQYYAFATPAVAALFYGLTGSMSIAMPLATTLMGALILLSLVWLLRPFVDKPLAVLGAMLALVASIFAPNAVADESAQLFFLMCSYYACYLICLLFVLGDYVRALQSGEKRPLPLALALLLSFLTGMNSLRQTCIMIAPLLVFELLRAIRRKLSQGRFFPPESRAALFRVLGYTAANLCGCGLIRALNVRHQTIYSGASVFGGASLSEKLRACWLALRYVSGLDAVTNTRSPLYLLLFLLFSAVLVWAGIIVLRSLREPLRALNACYILLALGIAAVFAASIFTSVSLRSIYVFMYYPLLAVSFAIVAQSAGLRLRCALAAALCALSLCNLSLSYGGNAKAALSDTPDTAREACEYIVGEGYEYVYGLCPISAAIARWSGGALSVGGWDEYEMFDTVQYLTRTDIFDEAANSKAVYVFLPYEYAMACDWAEMRGAYLTELTTIGDFIICTASEQLMLPVAASEG